MAWLLRRAKNGDGSGKKWKPQWTMSKPSFSSTDLMIHFVWSDMMSWAQYYFYLVGLGNYYGRCKKKGKLPTRESCYYGRLNWLGVYSQWKIHLPRRGNKFSHVEKRGWSKLWWTKHGALRENRVGEASIALQRTHCFSRPLAGMCSSTTLIPPGSSISGKCWWSSSSCYPSSRFPFLPFKKVKATATTKE